ncbi:MAG: hypothetical protein ABFD13_02080 [Candidatus Cryosericum sp.]
MKKLACIVVVIVAAFALMVPAGRAEAADDEHILSFDSVVTVHTDCTIAVQETITVSRPGSASSTACTVMFRRHPLTQRTVGRTDSSACLAREHLGAVHQLFVTEVVAVQQPRFSGHVRVGCPRVQLEIWPREQ